MALQFRRGTEAERVANGFVPLSGEPIYTTDSKKLYLGDGATVGGIPVGSGNDIGDIGDVELKSLNIISIQTVSAANNLVTVVTKTPHGLAAGESVLVSSVVRPQINGIHVIFEASISYITFNFTTADFPATTDTGALRYEVSDSSILAYDQTTGTWTDQTFVYEIKDLGDVEITNPVQDDVLQYSEIDGKFINKQFQISVDNLSDVLINEQTLSNRQILAYDPNLTVWRNIDYVDELQDLSNVTITNPIADQILSYNGSAWVNKTFELNNFDLNALTDVEIENAENGQILQFTDSKWRNVPNFVSLNQFADVELSEPFDGQAIIYEDNKFRSRAFRLADLENINDLTESFEVPNNSILAFSNTEQKWKPQAFTGLAQRTEIVLNTGPLEDLEIIAMETAIFPGFIIYKLKCSAAPTTVSMYVTEFYRDLDLSRPEDEFPYPGAGIYAEMTPPDTSYRVITPVIHGFNDEVPISDMAFFKIRNRSGFYQSNIEIRLTVLQVEKLPEY